MALIEVETEVAGSVWKIEAAAGTAVDEGDVLVILESMKMEIPIEAPEAGTLVELKVEESQAVDEGEVVAIIET